jgi:hypothetical protein
MADLVGFSPAPPPGPKVTDHHPLGAAGFALPLAQEQAHQGIGHVGSPGLVASLASGGTADAVGLGLQAVDETNTEFGRQGTGHVHHAGVVAPVPPAPSPVLATAQLLDIHGGQTAPTSFVAQGDE